MAMAHAACGIAVAGRVAVECRVCVNCSRIECSHFRLFCTLAGRAGVQHRFGRRFQPTHLMPRVFSSGVKRGMTHVSVCANLPTNRTFDAANTANTAASCCGALGGLRWRAQCSGSSSRFAARAAFVLAATSFCSVECANSAARTGGGATMISSTTTAAF